MGGGPIIHEASSFHRTEAAASLFQLEKKKFDTEVKVSKGRNRHCLTSQLCHHKNWTPNTK